MRVMQMRTAALDVRRRVPPAPGVGAGSQQDGELGASRHDRQELAHATPAPQGHRSGGEMARRTPVIRA